MVNHWLEKIADEIVAIMVVGAAVIVVVVQGVSGNPIDLPEWYKALVAVIVGFYFGHKI